MQRSTYVGLFAAAQLWAGDPRAGVWKLTSAHSVIDPPTKLIVTTQGPIMHVVTSGGLSLEFSAKPDGQDYPVKNSLMFNEIAIRKVDRNTSELSEKKSGTIVATVLERVSKDGNELDIVTRPKGRQEEIAVLRRTAGGKHLTNPFIGEWTHDPSASRLRQSLILTIELLANDQVYFSGDFSYTAKLDGKDYLLRGSPNDTVALHLTGARTVASSYKRGDQVVASDLWTVSIDGMHMNVTAAGVSPEGQRLKETLVFSKQPPAPPR